MNNQSKNTRKTALITGASSGIGRELAKCFANDGHDLILVARSGHELDTLAQELEHGCGITATTITTDLFEPEAARNLYEDVRGRGLQVDYLVNDAGQGEWGRFWETNIERHKDIVQLNVTSLVELTHAFLPAMVNRGEGGILQVASVASTVPMPKMAIYAATKAFVLSFSEALHYELRDTGVTCTALMPGATESNWWDAAGARNTKAGQDDSKSSVEDVARVGYEGLMAGEHRVIEGLSNKASVKMAGLVSDQTMAAQLADSMERANTTNSSGKNRKADKHARRDEKRARKATQAQSGLKVRRTTEGETPEYPYARHGAYTTTGSPLSIQKEGMSTGARVAIGAGVAAAAVAGTLLTIARVRYHREQSEDNGRSFRRLSALNRADYTTGRLTGTTRNRALRPDLAQEPYATAAARPQTLGEAAMSTGIAGSTISDDATPYQMPNTTLIPGITGPATAGDFTTPRD